jgi:hypothetical protein
VRSGAACTESAPGAGAADPVDFDADGVRSELAPDELQQPSDPVPATLVSLAPVGRVQVGVADLGVTGADEEL